MRSKCRGVLLAGVVVFALGAGVTASASATVSGPYFKNGAGVLGEGQTVALKVKRESSTSLLYWDGLSTKGALVACRAVSGEVKAYNEYVKGVLSEGRLKEAKIVLEDCNLVENHTCEVNGKEEASIPLEHALGRLGYKPGATEKEREEGKGVEELFYSEAGKSFSTLQFTNKPPETCTLPSTKWPMTGGIIWTGSPVNGLATSLSMVTKVVQNRGTHHFEAELTTINFPAFGETLTGQEIKLGSNIFSLETEELGLTPPAGVELGVFT
jgi:hypothetical protein